MNNVFIDLQSKFNIEYQEKKPIIFCDRCKSPIEPRGYCKFGWPVEQYLICNKCEQVVKEEIKQQQLNDNRKVRKANIRIIAEHCGAPSEKTQKINFDDCKSIVATKGKVTKEISFDQLFNTFLKYKSCLITGKSGSGKSHLATMLFMRSIYHFALDSEDNFLYTTLMDVLREIYDKPFEEKNIITKTICKRVLCFTFGEYDWELHGSDARISRLENTLFPILDKRLEKMMAYDLYTIWMTTLTEKQIHDLGFPFYRRFHEMSFIIDMGENKGYSEKMFQERPKVEVFN